MKRLRLVFSELEVVSDRSQVLCEDSPGLQQSREPEKS